MSELDQAAHILIVDDDRRIRELLKSYLADNGFRATAAASAAQAREAMRGLAFDLLIVDIMMPGETGIELVTALRANHATVPVLILSALGDPEHRIAGLASGSDDYLPKPFEPRELLLRVQSILRRAGPRAAASEEVRFGDYVFQLARGELRRAGALVHLTTRERDLLRHLARKPGTPLTRLDLAKPGTANGARGVDVQINRLRRKIEQDPSRPVHLQTVRGAGYVLQVD
jgi:two-component system, OmpR family, phosphate regulon response regulator OmpR